MFSSLIKEYAKSIKNESPGLFCSFSRSRPNFACSYLLLRISQITITLPKISGGVSSFIFVVSYTPPHGDFSKNYLLSF